MAETQQHAEPERRPPPNGTADDPTPPDLEAALAELKKLKAQHGALLNETKAAKKAREELTTKLRDWNALQDEHGVDPEQLKALLGKQHEDDLSKARDKGEIDKLLENQRKTHEKREKQLNDMLTAERELNNKVLLDNVLMTEMAKFCDPNMLDAVFALYRPKIEMVDDPESEYGRIAVAVVGGDHMTVPDYLNHLAKNDEKFARFLKPSLASGGGASGGAASSRLRMKPRKEMSAAEKSQYIRQHGVDEYNKLPWARDA